MACCGPKISPQKIDDNAVVIPLLGNEHGYGCDEVVEWHDGIMIASLFEVVTPRQGFRETLTQQLKMRMTEIIEKNPFLTSRLKHVQSDELNLRGQPIAISLVMQGQVNIDDYITVTNGENLEALDKNNLNRFRREILNDKRYSIGLAKTLIDNDAGQLARFGILWSADQKTCCILLTINHVLGDASTLYNLWKMLDAKNERVYSLIAEREHSFENEHMIGNKTHSFLPRNWSNKDFIFNYEGIWFPAAIYKGFTQNFKKRPRNVFIVTLDNDEIARRKAAYSTPEQFVSTNDVITAMMKDLVPKIEHIMMPINCRKRLGFSDELAGNYLANVMMMKKDMESPATVRAWLNKVSKPGYDWELPTSKDFRRYLGGFHTNWSSYYHHLEPENLRHIAHFPAIKDYDQYGPDELPPLPIGEEMSFYTFKTNKDQYGLYIQSRRKDITLETLLKHPMVAGELK